MDAAELSSSLQPLPYQQALAAHLAATEPAAWAWFSEDLAGPEYAERVRLELLKATYRMDRESKPQLYELADRVRSRLQVAAPITFYQMQRAPGDDLNASLFYIPGEAHIAFVGNLLESMNEEELAAIIGHELAHFVLLEGWQHRYRILEELLHALLQDQAAQPVHAETYRLYHLYKEIFCDRAALIACQDLHAAISLLVKVETAAAEVNAASYLRQTEEIFSKDRVTTEGLSHPECYIRTRAMQLWSSRPDDLEESIRLMIEGDPSLQGMDLLVQQTMMQHTRLLIDSLLAESWLCSDAVLAHARLFFDDLKPPDREASDDELQPLREIRDDKLREYLCYVLLDFAACDPDLEEPALAATLLLSRRLSLDTQFRRVATKELKLNKRNFDTLEQEAEYLLAAARQAAAQEAGSQS